MYHKLKPQPYGIIFDQLSSKNYGKVEEQPTAEACRVVGQFMFFAT